MMNVEELKNLSGKIRIKILQTIYRSKASHIASNLSIVEILSVLYGRIMNFNPKNPKFENRDRFILSKGHAAVAVYSVLSEFGFFPDELLDSYSQNNSPLLGHISHHVPGVELSTGSLGHGLPVGAGIALAGKADNKNFKVFVLLSDGELDEGSNWEAFLFAPHHKLDNLIVIIDYNKIQSYGKVEEILSLEPLRQKFEAFMWNVIEVDGHNLEELVDALGDNHSEKGKPRVVIAHTVKGKGISFMEDNNAWHYKNPSVQDYENALRELNK